MSTVTEEGTSEIIFVEDEPEVYQKMDQITHVLERTATYIGSKTLKIFDDYVATVNSLDEDMKPIYSITKKQFTNSNAFLRIFIEIISNAIDNVERSKLTATPCTTIKVSINKETGETSVWNDGAVIPIEINKIEKIYNHSLIFGQLLTGSNYGNNERTVSGVNGIGCKACNIFSTKFVIKGIDPVRKLSFEQTWTNNMRTVSEPIIKSSKLKTGYTHVTYFPDFPRFFLDGYTDDIIEHLTRYIIETAMLTKVKVYLNDCLLPVNSLLTYAKLYEPVSDDYYVIKTPSSEVVISTSTGDFEAISYVNGICTPKGGVHVDLWSEAIFRPIVEKFTKKDKPAVNIKDVKQFFRLFIVTVVPNPEFSSQEKEKLESPKPTDVVVKSADITKIMKWAVMSEIEDVIKSKEMLVLKKTEKKKKGYVKIKGYDRANFADTKKSYLCGLIICEGDSAAKFASDGIEKGVYGYEGPDYFGILALTGKCLNVRNSDATKTGKNVVITKLVQSLNLQYGLDYTIDENFKTLSYGKVIILTDADVDGIHIEGLLMNFFHFLFPSLLKREEAFLVSMKTPIVRVYGSKKGVKDLLFYDENRFKRFRDEQGKPISTKYYKGLGTTKPEDVPDIFGEKIIEYRLDEKTPTIINKVFATKFADERKKWLENYNPQSTDFSLDDTDKITPMDMSYFLDNEMIKFSMDDCGRSIPSLFDGLKESQRKILFAVKKRGNLGYNTKKTIKVAQLANYAAEVSAYHHGENNLCGAIVNMAQEYPGSNNIPLLYRDGQFGSLKSNGNDAASPRYIFTKMEALTHLLFRTEDDVLLEHNEDDGNPIEPKFYIPILPTVLINGAHGIGTGWSSSIPCYNPLDIIDCVKTWIANNGSFYIEDDGMIVSHFPDLLPYYRGFTGTIELKDNKIITSGVITKEGKKTRITQLPIGMSYDQFKEMCEDWIVEKKIKSFFKNSSNRADFTITETDDGFSCNLTNLKLKSSIAITNMVLFNEKQQLKKYTLEQIIHDFCVVRYKFYEMRKQRLLTSLQNDLEILSNKARFVNEIAVEKTLNIMNIEENVLYQELEKRGYTKQNSKIDDGEHETGGYEYLLRLQVKTFTEEKVKILQKEREQLGIKLDTLIKTTENELWLRDIDDFKEAYEKWVIEMEKISNKKIKKETKGVKKEKKNKKDE